LWIAALLSANWVSSIREPDTERALTLISPAASEPAAVSSSPAPPTLLADQSTAQPSRPQSAECDVPAVVAETTSHEPAALADLGSPVVQHFLLAARLAAVSRLNAPCERAARRGGIVAPAGRKVPKATAPEVKVLKLTRLPTAVSTRALSKAPRPTAQVIEISTARTQRQTASRRAA
jgi:hypothetical protein